MKTRNLIFLAPLTLLAVLISAVVDGPEAAAQEMRLDLPEPLSSPDDDYTFATGLEFNWDGRSGLLFAGILELGVEAFGLRLAVGGGDMPVAGGGVALLGIGAKYSFNREVDEFVYPSVGTMFNFTFGDAVTMVWDIYGDAHIILGETRDIDFAIIPRIGIRFYSFTTAEVPVAFRGTIFFGLMIGAVFA